MNLSVPVGAVVVLITSATAGYQHIENNYATKQHVQEALEPVQQGLNQIRAALLGGELDALYSAQCSGYNGNDLTIRSMEAQYYDLVGTNFRQKTCEFYARVPL